MLPSIQKGMLVLVINHADGKEKITRVGWGGALPIGDKNKNIGRTDIVIIMLRKFLFHLFELLVDGFETYIFVCFFL